MRFLNKIIVVTFLMLTLLIGTQPALAFDPASTGLTKSGDVAGFKTDAKDNNLSTLVGNIIRAFLVLIGLILMIIIIYGGILYMTSAGNDEQVKKAKSFIINGIIGVVIIALAFAISTFVLDQIGQATSATTEPTGA